MVSTTEHRKSYEANLVYL